ncbi:hypothetical protein [Paracoccus sp. PAR01]|uniref:hypothetical protein n=1 Tax=Paracoccus sp. PAR01 TaxID=2769282 RepID=UPI00177FF70C|nr:hypothetical protein [Paracoccus sp. PAR01]MBD9529946.1 hypothetical protein [Paracoccus sp. PAR01]
MFHATLPAPITDTFVQLVEAATGHPVRWSSALPIHCALQWDRTRNRAGLIYRNEPGHLAFAILSFDDTLIARCDIGPEDLAMIGLARLGLVALGTMPRPLRRCVKVRPVPPVVVARHLATTVSLADP